MLSFLIETEEVKNFMNKLLKTDTFDQLEVRQILLENLVRYEINCAINKEYLQGEERDFVKWKEIKPYIVSLIKGNKKPKILKIIFSLSENKLEKIHSNAKALFLNLTYENEEIIGTTGTSQKNFSLEKTLDLAWEDFILNFFKENSIKIKLRVLEDN